MPRKRKRDQDGIFTRPDSPYWWASFTNERGKPTRRSTRIRCEEDPQGLKAKAVRAKWVFEADASRVAGATTDEIGHTFDELMIAYLKNVSINKKSGDSRDKQCIKKLYPAFSGKDLSALTAIDARSYIDSRKRQGAAAGTINKEIGLFSAALNWAKRELEWDVSNPFQGRRLKEPPGRNRWLTKKEALRLIQAAEQSTKAPHLVDFIILGLNTGMRPGEMLALDWDRVDLTENLIYFNEGDQKNDRLGSVPVNKEARQALISRARFRSEHCPDSRWVFCKKDGSRILKIKRSFRTAVINAGLEDVRPHDLRRTCGSWLAQSGVSINTISLLLRHSDISVTQRVYAHLSPVEIRAAVDVLNSESGYKVSRSGFTLVKNEKEVKK
jgi:integrase